MWKSHGMKERKIHGMKERKIHKSKKSQGKKETMAKMSLNKSIKT